MVNLNDELMAKLFSNAHKQERDIVLEHPEIKDDLNEEDALKVYNEVLDIMVKHNLSYRNACRIAIALAEAFLTGAVELYDKEQ